MILSERHKFIFVKGMKVAGTSVEIALSDLCGPQDIVTPVTPIDELLRMRRGSGFRNFASNREVEERYRDLIRRTPESELDALPPAPLGYYNHMPLAAVAIRYGRDISGFRIVCIERSPYAKVISWANMQLSYKAYETGREMRSELAEIANAVDRGFENGSIREPRNIDRYRGLDGKIRVTAMRYETLPDDFATFVRGLGVSTIPSLPHVKKGLLSEKLDPAKILRRDQIERVNQLFAEEFETFGYEKL